MDQTPKICRRCQQANFPIAEFCRHCGEPLFEMGSLSRSSVVTRLLGHLGNGFFWVIDELARWWEIGRLTVDLKTLRRRRAGLMKGTADGGTAPGEGLPPDERDRVVALTEEISRLGAREEFLRKKSWALSPELLLVAIILLFVAGIIWLRPRTDLTLHSTPALSGAALKDLRPAGDFPLSGFGVVTTAAWFEGKFYIGGDGGLAVFDPAIGVATSVAGLPPEFFVRHLSPQAGHLLIAGYGGVYQLDAAGINPLYRGDGLPVDLVNRIAATQDGGHLLGTVGYGLLKARQGVALLLLGTQGLSIRGFEWLDGEMWLLHERGLMKGDGATFEPFNLQVLGGKTLQALAVGPGVLYLGSNDGVVAGYKGDRNWVWTPLSPGEPKVVNDLQAVEGALLVCAEEGVFRFSEGAFTKFGSTPGQKALAVGGGMVLTARPGGLQLFRSTVLPVAGQPAVTSVMPTVGTFVPEVVPNAPLTVPVVSGPPTPVPAAPPAIVNVPQTIQPPAYAPPQGAPTNFAPPPLPAAPSTGDPLFDASTVPAAVRGPSATSVLWDGRRFWVGTTNEGIWFLQDNRWTNLSAANGELKDNQIVSLWQLQGRPYLYSWLLGLMALDSGKAVPAVPPSLMQDFLAVGSDAKDTLLLFKGGHLRRLTPDGRLEPFQRIPEDFFTGARFVQLVDGKPVVVADQGVLTLEPNGRWKITFFQVGAKTRVTAATVFPPGKLVAGLEDGSVLAFENQAMTSLGKLGEPVRAMAVADSLYVAGTNTLFRYQNGSFVAVGPRFRDLILSFQVLPERRAVAVVTSFGVRGIPMQP